MTQHTILITRPKGDEESLRDALVDSGHRVIHEPLTDIYLRHNERANIEAALMEDPDAILVTSRHGAAALALLTEIRDVFLLCVGEATMEAALALGFTRVSNTGGTVDHMIDYIMDSYDDEARFVYISGEHVRTDFSDTLGVRGISVTRVIAYDAVAATQLSDTLVAQLQRGQINAVTFFSPRAAQIFLSLAEKSDVLDALEQMDAFCLSGMIADAAAAAQWRTIYAAEQPTLASIVESVDNVYHVRHAGHS